MPKLDIQCPACQKMQPEGDLMIGSSLKQRCNFCGALFEVNVETSAFKGNEKISSKIVSKGLLDLATEDILAFKVEPKIRTLFAMFLFIVGAVILMVTGAPLQTAPLIFLAVICVTSGLFAGMLAGGLGYSEVLTPGGAGVIAGLVLAILISVQLQEMAAIFRSALPIFSTNAVGTILGGMIAWTLRKFFNIKLDDAGK
jgi:hypothetical protein